MATARAVEHGMLGGARAACVLLWRTLARASAAPSAPPAAGRPADALAESTTPTAAADEGQALVEDAPRERPGVPMSVPNCAIPHSAMRKRPPRAFEEHSGVDIPLSVRELDRLHRAGFAVHFLIGDSAGGH